MLLKKYVILLSFTFTFMHLADTFIQSDLQCIQVTVFFKHFISSLSTLEMVLLLNIFVETMIHVLGFLG